jgi:hypothetical protein
MDSGIPEPSEKVDHCQCCTRKLERVIIQEERTGSTEMQQWCKGQESEKHSYVWEAKKPSIRL